MSDIAERTTVGVDIGTSKISVAVGQSKESLVNITSLVTAPCSGLRKGTVVDPDETVSSLSNVLDEAQRVAGCEISHAVIGYGGLGIVTAISKGVVAVSRADNEINEDDIAQALESARAIALPPNQEILHLFPTQFTIDGQENVKDPRGMQGIRLETEAITIGAPVASLRNLTKVVNQAGLEIDAVIFNPIAASRALLNKKQKELGVVLLDIGAATTSMVVFEEGDLIDAHVFPVGSGHITGDIAIGLKTTLDIAEKVKCHHLQTDTAKLRDGDKLDLHKIDEREDERVSKKYLAEIVDARLKELFGMVRKELKRIKRDSLLPAGVVLTGGGAKLKGIVSHAKEILRLPAQVGVPSIEIGGTIDKLDDPSYATSIGLALLGFEIDGHNAPPRSKLPLDFKNIKLGGVVGKAKQLFKQLLP